MKTTFTFRHLVPLSVIKDCHRSIINHIQQGMRPNKGVTKILEDSPTWPAASKIFEAQFLAYFLENQVMNEGMSPEQIGSITMDMGENPNNINLEEVLDEAMKLKENP